MTENAVRRIGRAMLPRAVRAGIALVAARSETLAAALKDRLHGHQEPWPIPPPRLRYRVQGAASQQSFLAVGKQCATDISRCLGGLNRPFETFSEVLDFGCGVGRVLRWFGQGAATTRLHGVDIDPEAIAWCRDALPFASFAVTPHTPPLPYADASFDLIYGISVFTHLDEAMQFQWLKELRRVTRDKGLLLLTVHGESLHGALRSEERDEVARKGFVFRTEVTGRLKPDGLPDFYQTTFHRRDYVEQYWTKYFSLVSYQDRAMAGFQDVVLLAPR